MSQNRNTGKSTRSSRPLLAVIVLAVALAGVYGIFALQGNSSRVLAGSVGQQPVQKVTRDMAIGAMRNLIIRTRRRPAGDVTFVDGQGKQRHISEWRGKVILLNFWASWCGPCRKEMPQLVKLQKAFPRKEFIVLAASEDRKGYQWAKEALEDMGAQDLFLLMDENAKALRTFNERGLPTTILLDKNGDEFGRLIGPAEWASEDAMAIIRAAIAEPGGGK